MLSEAQIQRYSRQILLREVGGVGQELLLSTPVAILGSSEAFEVARLTLGAGGTPIDPRATLSIGPPASHPSVVISAWAVAAGCTRCVDHLALESRDGGGPSPTVLLGSLAALFAQRLILDRHSRLSLARWSGHTLLTEHPDCPH